MTIKTPQKPDKSAPKRARGRPRLDPSKLAGAEQVRLTMPAGGKDQIRAVLREDESMLAFLRAAIEREIMRRRR